MTTQHPEFSLKATAKGFNVYSGPGNSYDRVEYIEVGTGTEQYTVEGKDAVKAVWYEFQYDSNHPDRTAWIRAAHVESDDDLSGVSVTWTPVQLSLDSNANVRSGPDADYDTVGSITAGTKYPVLGKDSDLDQDRDAWYEIQYDPTHPDCTGWVPAAQARIHDAQASIQQDALPVTWLPPLIS